MDESFIRTHDIDWFFRTQEHYYHVASAGGDIPEFVKDPNNHLRTVCQAYSETTTDIFLTNLLRGEKGLPKVGINKDFLNNLFGQNTVKMKEYLRSFVEMAVRGYYSFDKKDINCPDEDKYVLIAWPEEDRTPNNEYVVKMEVELDVEQLKKGGEIDLVRIINEGTSI